MNTKSRYPMYVLIFLIIIFVLMIFANVLASSNKTKNETARENRPSSLIRKDLSQEPVQSDQNDLSQVSENQNSETFQNQVREESKVDISESEVSSNNNAPKRPEVCFNISSSEFNTFNTDDITPNLSLSDANKDYFAVLKNIDNTRLLLLVFSRKPELLYSYEIEPKNKKPITPVSLSFSKEKIDISFSVEDDMDYNISLVADNNASGNGFKYVKDASGIESFRLLSYPNKVLLPTLMVSGSFRVDKMNYYIVLDVPDLDKITDSTTQVHFDAYLYQEIQNKLYCRQKLFSDILRLNSDIDFPDVVEYELEDDGYLYFKFVEDVEGYSVVKIKESDLALPPKSYSNILLLDSKFNEKTPSYPITIFKKYK